MKQLKIFLLIVLLSVTRVLFMDCQNKTGNGGNGENIIYETHVYDPISEFQDLFIEPAKTLPVIIGEFGPVSGYMSINDCKELIIQAESLKIPYLAWTFHMRCPPNFLVDYSNGGCGTNMPLEPTPWGELLIEYLNQSD